MSTNIDEKIVEMRFDNKQFEKNVQTSINSIENLNRSLDMSGASKGLESVSNAARRIDMSGLSSAVETVGVRFSALQVLAVTTLANIANSAVNAGKNMLSALTIQPITTGFQEYETQINAVQTILANTQQTSKQVVKQTSSDIQATSEEVLAATKASNKEALKSLQKTHKEELREYQKLADDELDVLEEKQDEILDTLEKTHKEELREYEKLADEELEILEDKHDTELEDLEKALDEESKLLKQAHQEKLDLYEEEYMEKLKSVDEERYNKIKAIDDEIDAINGLTKSENEALELEKQNAKLAELRSDVTNAKTYDERQKAEQKLAEYQDEIARKKLLKERESQIAQLELSKSNIEAEYDAKEKELKAEYEAKKTEENELYELKSEQLKEDHEAQIKALKETHEEEKELLKEQLDLEKEAIQERQDSESKALNKTHEEEKKLLKEQLDLEKEAIQERHDAEIESLNATHEVAINNIKARQNAAEVETIEVEPSTLEDVNKALDELNEYADKTIYNFTEMTRNIGTFTAAGVDLDTSVQAIKGIANLGAVSGSTSNQVSTAMYQISQALSAGRVSLQDWNSIVNAGMGGQVFQDSLKETARAHGIAIDDIIAQEGSFRESLSKGWLSTDILTETLSKFTGDLSEEQLASMGYTEEQIAGIIKMGQTASDAATKVKTFTQLFDTLKEAAQSGWTQSWEIIVGDFEEAKELLTELSDIFGGIINESSKARNEMLQGWSDLGGRTALINAMKNAFEGVASVIKPVSEAFKEIFPPMTGEQLYNITKGLEELTSKLKLSDTQSANLKATFKGLFAILDIGKELFLAIWNAVKPLIGGVGDLGDGILGVTASMGDWLVNLRDSIKESGIFNDALQAIVGFIRTTVGVAVAIVKSLVDGVKSLFNTIKEKVDFSGFELLHDFLERFRVRLSNVSEGVKTFCDAVGNIAKSIGDSIKFDKILEVLDGVWEGIKKIASSISEACKPIGEGIANAVGDINFNTGIDLVNGGLLAGLLVTITKFVKGAGSIFEGFGSAIKKVTSIVDNVKSILDSVRGCFEAYQENIKAKTLLTIASAIAILTASILVLSIIDSVKLAASIGALTAMFGELMGSMAIFSKLSGSKKDAVQVSAVMISLSVSVLILAAALKTISSIDTEKLLGSVLGITALISAMVATVKLMSTDDKKVTKGVTSLIAFSIAVKILASACSDLSELSWEELAKGLLGAGAIMAAVVLFTKNTGKAEHVISTGTAMVLLGAAMKIFASAVKDFAAMNWEELGRGLLGMAGALAAITIALNLMPENMVGTGIGLIAVSTALIILSEALENMGEMSWTAIAKGMTALGGSMAILAVGLNVMTGTVAGAAALLIAAAALAVLTPVLGILGGMSWAVIATGLIAIAGAFTVIGVAGLVLAPLVPAIVALCGSFALLGAGILAIGTGLVAAGSGLTALAAGFTALAAMGIVGATALVKTLEVIITGVAGLIPAIVTKIAEGIIKFCETIANGAPSLCESFVTVVKSIVSALIETVPTIVEGIFVLLDSVLTTLVEYAPKIVQSVYDILIACLEGIANNIGMVTETAIEVVVEFLNGIAEKIDDVVEAGVNVLTSLMKGISDGILTVTETAVEIGLAFLEGIASLALDFAQGGFDILISFINGITDSIEENTPILVDAISELVLALVDAGILVLTGGVDLFKDIGEKIMNNGLIKGITDKISTLCEKVGGLISDAIETVKETIKDWTSIGKDIVDGLIKGITSAASGVWDAAKSVVSDAVDGVKDFLGINSPSKEFAKIGRWSDEGLVSGLTAYAGNVSDAAEDVGKGALTAMSDAISGISEIVNDEMDAEPTIRPVLDLSNVEAGTKSINAMFSRTQAMDVNAHMNGRYGTIDADVTTAPSSGTTYQFTQNNYSPKALSSIEIYRQTKNQFSAMKRMVEA